MHQLSKDKYQRMLNVSTEDGIISALAIDQRGQMRKMIGQFQEEPATKEQIEGFKSLVSKELTKYASSILLDPEFGLPASKVRAEGKGLLLAYERTGFDPNVPGRLPHSLDGLSVQRLKAEGADCVKYLLYYDVDESDEINDIKKAYMERVGAECEAEGLPFYLELLSYDHKDEDNKSFAFAKVKPHKVNEMMKEFSKPQYRVDVLKAEVPVNMNYVEGFATGDEIAYSREEALGYFKEQSDATHLPYIFLSAGVSAQLFIDTLHFAKEADAEFNGVLCGRATWKDGVGVYITEGEEATNEWLQTIGKENISRLQETVEECAVPWFSKVTEATE